MKHRVTVYKDNRFYQSSDNIAIEEVLELSITQGGKILAPIFIMCSTDKDIDYLAIGFLFNEGIITHTDDVIDYSMDNHKVIIHIKDQVNIDSKKINRTGFVNSSCGACGKESLKEFGFNNPIQLSQKTPLINSAIFSMHYVLSLIDRFNLMQQSFKDSGGVHGCAIFTPKIALMKEDIGRHNALDKLIGELFLSQKLPLEKAILFLSGRISYELVQKAIKADIKVIVAFGAPSSLAIELAISHHICLIGFVKANSCNIYTHSNYIDTRG